MVKKLTIGQFIRRVVLLLLAAIIVILLLVFFLDRYKAQNFNNVNNIYDDEYFNRENLKDEGFQFYSDYQTKVLEYNKSSGEAYQNNLKNYLNASGLYKYLTYKRANFNVDNSADTLKKVRELIKLSRYKEETSYFFNQYDTNINNLNKELEKMIPFSTWALDNFEMSEVLEDLIETETVEEVMYWKVNGVISTVEATKEELAKGRPVASVNSDGFVVINDTVVTNVLSLSKTTATWATANEFYNVSYASVLDFVQARGKADASIDDVKTAIDDAEFDSINLTTDEDKIVFMYLLKQDFDKNVDESLFSTVTGFSKTEYENLEYVISELKNIKLVEIDEINSSLYTWKDYYSNILLGYEGVANPTKTIKYELEDGTGRYYEVSLNAYTAAFKYYLKSKTGEILSEWASNPDVVDDSGNQHIYQHTQFTLYYSSSRGRTLNFTTYEHSVSDHSATEDLTPNFAVKYDEEQNKLIVWYEVEQREIDYSYFPQYISVEHMNELIERNKQMVADGVEGVMDIETTKEKSTLAITRLTKNFYALITKDNIANQYGIDYYEHQGSYTNMSKIERNYLYRYLYQWCGYCATDESGNYINTYDTETQEGLNDLSYDNAIFGLDVNNVKPKFSFAVEYSLNKNGLSVLIPGNSIRETEKYPLCYIDILPYFTATPSGVEGYTVIPDGSGEVLIHDNGNTAYPKYNKRVYTKDLTDTKYVNEGETSDLLLPIYGVVNESNEGSSVKRNGILAYITSNAASFGFTADPTRDDNYFNMNYYTLYIREDKDVIFGQAAYERTEFTKWTNIRNAEDTVLNYAILVSDDLSYNDLANKYREILIDKYGLSMNDNTTTPTLDIDVIGMYSYKDNIAGIQYKAKDTLTTFDELKTMVDELLGTGVKDINIAYLGWRNTGLSNKSFRKLKVSNLCGSKAKFQALLDEYSSDSNVTLYPYVDFIEYESFYESFGKYHYVAHAVDGNLAYRQPYDLSSNIFDKLKGKIYALSPRYYLVFAEKLAKNYTKASGGADTLAVRNLGSTLVGDYKRNIETFKANAVEAQIEALDKLSESGIRP